MAFRFRVYLPNGEKIGDHVTPQSTWRPGDHLFDDQLTRFEIVDVVDLTDMVDPNDGTEPVVGALVVKPLELAEPG